MGSAHGRRACRLGVSTWLSFLCGYFWGRRTAVQRPSGQPDSTAKEATEPEDKTSKGAELVGILGLIAPLAAALGTLALTGTVGRIQRNAAPETRWAFILVVVASGFWGVGLLLKAKDKWNTRDRWSFGLRSVATVLAALGTVLALKAAITTAERQPRPHISVSLNSAHTVVTATVTASSLRTESRLAIFVDGLVWPPASKAPNRKISLYEAYVGPDKDGNVTQTASVAVPAKQGFTHIGVQAFTGKVSRGCDDLQQKAEHGKSGAPARPDSQIESGTGCVVQSLAK
jgi:hypothetical protein